MDIKERLKEYLKKYKKQISIKELIKKLNLQEEQIDVILESLYELEKEGTIFFDKNKTYMHTPKEFIYKHGIIAKSKSNQYYIKTKEGIVYIIKNIGNAKEGDIVYVSNTNEKTNHPKQLFGKIERIVKKESLKTDKNNITKGIIRRENNNFYIMINEQKIYIPKESLNTAFIGDLVNISIKDNIGNVVQVLKRHRQQHIFKCVNKDGTLKWIPISSHGFYELNKKKCKEGDLIVAEIKDNQLKLIKKIENNHTTQDDINALIMEYGFARNFSINLLEEATKLSKSSKISEEELKNRRDLRNLETITIDPIDAKDLDDAISIEYKNGLYTLYVHAANPTHYIKLNSPLFKEALKRGFSVYPPNGVIPMLPDTISSGICSLNENGDKLALTCKMVINEQGEILDIDIFKSIIKSDKQMNYDSVNSFLQTMDQNHEYASFTNTLIKMKELANILQREKTKRGSINFESEEKQFIIDQEGNPVSLKEKQRGESQLIIENFMLLANENISKFAFYLGLPYIYRNHDQPTVQKKQTLKQDLTKKGYYIQKIGNISHPEYLQSTLNNLLKGKTKEEKKVISELFLKSMTRAYYEDINKGHYGLALDCYGTFTSPARKISDLLNHMIIEEFLDNGIESPKIEIYRDFIAETVEYISEKQKDADSLEQEIERLILTKYAEKFKNEEVTAKILFINQTGIYIKDTNGLTGLIPINKQMTLYNQQLHYNGKIYKPSDQITVSLKAKKENELIYQWIPATENKKILKK